ncbi:MAG TPA: radical SAM protein [Steroidobacteraceae bacterium]|nr:radical SAM protein [Steroidobacteraceae bacterium]
MHTAVLDADATAATALRQLPLVTLYLSERCNSRCITCDYWRHGTADMDLDSIRRLLPDLHRLQTRVALISGGEPLLNPAWREIAELLHGQGLRLWLLTSGLSLAKHAQRVAALFEAVTVSLDGTERSTYEAIRGLDAFDKVCQGIRAAARTGTAVSVRVTLQRANYRQLPRFVALARELGARQVSFLAVDVANPHAFARQDEFTRDLALRKEDLPELAAILEDLERNCGSEFRSGMIADSPRKLRGIHQYFSAVCGLAEFPAVRCNVYDYSAVIGATGRVSPCFFISGPPPSVRRRALGDILNDTAMSRLREQIRSGNRPECRRCVCSLWRSAGSRAAIDFLPPAPGNA